MFGSSAGTTSSLRKFFVATLQLLSPYSKTGSGNTNHGEEVRFFNNSFCAADTTAYRSLQCISRDWEVMFEIEGDAKVEMRTLWSLNQTSDKKINDCIWVLCYQKRPLLFLQLAISTVALGLNFSTHKLHYLL
jgi:hypothetical protein